MHGRTAAYDAAPGLRAIVICAAVGLLYAGVGLLLVVVDPRSGVVPKPPDFGNTIFESEGLMVLGTFIALVWWMTVVIQGLRKPSPDHSPLRVLVGIASLLSASVGALYLLLLMIFVQITGSAAPNPLDKTSAWVYNLVMGSWPVALLIFLGALLLVRLARNPAAARRRRQIGRGLVVVVLLAPLTWPALVTLVRAVPVDVAVCTMSTVFALWAIHGMQRHRRIPFWVLLAATGWGVLVATGLGATCNNIVLMHGPGIVPHFEALPVMLGASPALFEELAKGAGVIAVYWLTRRWFDNVASGVVLGAAVGLGFNFNETLLYMTWSEPMFQYWVRQSLGTMVAHTAYTALVGAGIGIAHQARSAHAKRLAISAGLTAAMCAHFANNYLGGRMSWWSGLSDNSWVSVLLLTPGQMLMLQGPFLLAYVVLLRRGLRYQHDALQVEIPDEVASAHGAIAPDEADALLTPARRFRLHVDAFRRGGPAAYRRSSRLHAAQLDLAMLRWHQRRGEPPLGGAALDAARHRVLRLKIGAPSRISPTPAVSSEVAR